MERQDLAERLSELGRLIWQAIQSDDKITELVFELADAKLSLDKVNVEDTRVEPDAADVIMGIDRDEETLARERLSIKPSEWLKYSVYNLALDWVMDQALMRMKMQQKWPFQENDGFPKLDWAHCKSSSTF